jgi:hypothetical protein
MHHPKMRLWNLKIQMQFFLKLKSLLSWTSECIKQLSANSKKSRWATVALNAEEVAIRDGLM